MDFSSPLIANLFLQNVLDYTYILQIPYIILMNIVVFCSLPNQNQLVSIHFLSYLKISQHFEIKVHIYNIDDISLILTVLCFWLEYGIENYTDQGI